MKKFLVIGGNVVSKLDGQVQYLPPRDIGRLYKVIEKECVFAHDDDDPKVWAYRRDPEVIILRARPDGSYNLPKIIQEFEKAKKKRENSAWGRK